MALAIVLKRETISSVSSSTGFTAANIPPTDTSVLYASVQTVDGDVRFTVDGTTPTSTLGQRLLQDHHFEVHGAQALIDFRCIDDGGSAKLEVVYMGRGG